MSNNSETLEQRITEAKEALDSMDDFARMANIDAIGPRKVLAEFIDFAAALGAQEPICYLREEWLHYSQSNNQDLHAFPVFAAPVVKEGWQMVPKEHVCGLQGFGALDDVCPACESAAPETSHDTIRL